MKEGHGVFIPEQHQLRRKLLIPFPELKQYRKVGSDRDQAGNISAGKFFLYLPGLPADPVWRVEIIQIDPCFIRDRVKPPDQHFLIIFHKEFFSIST